MLFKTLSASVYGIDAYLVEVDVGLGRMGDFNVVGLPDRPSRRAANGSIRPEKLRLRVSVGRA